MRLKTLLAGYPKRIIEALDGCGIKTDEDLLSSSSTLPELWQRLPPDSVTFSELEQVRKTVIDSLAASGISGVTIVEDPQTSENGSQSTWTTTCSGLTILLSSVQAGVIEVAGDKGSAKTALILNAAVTCLTSSKANIVHWIDTTGDFSAERASKILCSTYSAQHPGNSSERSFAPSVLDRLNVSLAFKAPEAYAALESVRSQALTSIGEGGPSHVRLIVIDSITPLFASHLSSGSSEGHAMMSAFMRTLQDVTMDLGAIALVANNASTALPSNPASCFAATKLKPTLGLTLTFLTDATLWLAPARSVFTSVSKPVEMCDAGSSNERVHTRGEEDLDNVYIAEVLRSRHYTGPGWWSFRLNENGVLCDFPSTP